jgi:hypothetical protein
MMSDLTWSKGEKQVARKAFEKAYEGECAEILARVREMAVAAKGPRDLWRIHDFLEEKRRETDQKYDYRYSVLILVFGRLVREGRLTIGDLEGLSEDKIARIQGFVRLAREWSEHPEQQEQAGTDDENAQPA